MKKVLIFGGTHGNEWTGIAVVENYAERFKKKFPKLDLEFIFANPEAHKINRRFKDEDLNRAFQFLGENRPHSYENQRAREIQKKILSGPCFVIDLHTTTSSMGNTLIVTDYNPEVLWVSDRAQKNVPGTRVIGSPDPKKKYLASQIPQSLMIEVGPVPNGIVEPRTLEGTLALLDEIFSALEDLPENPSGSIELYVEVEDLKYPLDSDGKIAAYIHPSFQGSDFKEINGDYTPFRSFSGEDLNARTDGPRYPIFINEAAYYPQHQAYTLCEKRVFTF